MGNRADAITERESSSSPGRPLDLVRLTTYYVRLWHIEESEEGVREGDEEGEWENGEGTNG